MRIEYTITYLILLWLLTIPSLNAQTDSLDPIEVVGFLVSETSPQEGLAFATVSAYTSSDSILADNALSENDGRFQLQLTPGTYYLVIQFLGYQDKTVSSVQVRNDVKLVELGKIVVQESAIALEGVEVQAERSQMELKLDKRVFNVGKDLSGAGNTAADILNNVPSVNVDQEGNVSLRGSQGVRILVDGKPSALISSGDMDALRRMQGDIIESIEVITNPSSKYEAEGEAGIINIVLKKNKKKGVNGSFGLNSGYPANAGASYSLNFRQEKVNLFSNFGIAYRTSPGGGNTSQQFFDNGLLETFFTSNTDRNRKGVAGNFQLGADWFLNAFNTITGSLLYRRSLSESTSDLRYTDLTAASELIRQTDRKTVEISNDNDLESALSYKRTFQKKDQVFTFDFKYILADGLEESDVIETTTTASSPLLQLVENTEYETNMLLQADYVHPFNDSTKLEAGLRSTLRTIKNRFLVEQADDDGQYVALAAFDDELRYTENIHAAYLIGAMERGKIGIQGGIRSELSDITARLLKSNQSNIQDYLNFFPSLSISYQITPAYQLQTSYSRRLSRPSFRTLLPFSNYNDPRNNIVGNPGLRPEFTDAYEAGLLRYLEKGSFLAGAYYRHTTGIIERLVLPAEDGTAIRYPVNLGERDAYGLELNGSYDLASWWKMNADVNVYAAKVRGQYEGTTYNADIQSWSGRATSKMKLRKKLEWQASFSYRAPENNPQGRTRSIYHLDTGASMDVLAGKGTVTLSGRDLFNTDRERRIVDLPNYKAESVFQWRQTRQVSLSFVYRLNQAKSRDSDRKPRSSMQEE